MATVPETTPVTTPVDETVAIAELLEDHVPFGVVLLNVIVEPTHNDDAPVIAAIVGNGLTVTVVVTALVQPLALV